MSPDRLFGPLVREIRRNVRGPGGRLLLDVEARGIAAAIQHQVAQRGDEPAPRQEPRAASEILTGQLAELQGQVDVMAAGGHGAEIAAEARAELARLAKLDAEAALIAAAARAIAAGSEGDG